MPREDSSSGAHCKAAYPSSLLARWVTFLRPPGIPVPDVPIPIEVILGSGGLAVFAVWVVNELWKAHKASDQDVREQRDAAVRRLEDVIGLVKKADE